jgi:alginate O-acetyltransferase complex protein AlgI
MIFFSYQFAVFTVLFFLVYWIAAWPAVRRISVLCACLVFQFHFAGPVGVLPIFILASGTFLAGYSRNRLLCAIWIGVCVFALVFYKYTHFLFQDALGFILPNFAKYGEEGLNQVLPALPPLGISFFVFEFVHYLVEIQRGGRPIRSPLRFSLFAAFWPSLVAGPIKRYRQFSVSMSRGMRSVSSNDVMIGMTRVTIGTVKKYGGDMLTGWIQYKQADFDYLPLNVRWLVFLGIGLRILLDFSGYSDMAIGFARMMGIGLPENFNWPYLAGSIIDFWRRWHISLSTWIRDYIYIPLGGSRHGFVRKGLNAFAAMALCGLWHGAAWNFMLWGLYHGVGLAVAGAAPIPKALVAGHLPGISSLTDGAMSVCILLWRAVSWAATLMFVLFGWLLFFYPVDKALHMSALLLGLE